MALDCRGLSDDVVGDAGGLVARLAEEEGSGKSDGEERRREIRNGTESHTRRQGRLLGTVSGKNPSSLIAMGFR